MMRELKEVELSIITGGIYGGGSTGGDDDGVGVAISKLSNARVSSLNSNSLSGDNSGDVGGDDGVGLL